MVWVLKDFVDTAVPMCYTEMEVWGVLWFQIYIKEITLPFQSQYINTNQVAQREKKKEELGKIKIEIEEGRG